MRWTAVGWGIHAAGMVAFVTLSACLKYDGPPVHYPPMSEFYAWCKKDLSNFSPVTFGESECGKQFAQILSDKQVADSLCIPANAGTDGKSKGPDLFKIAHDFVARGGQSQGVAAFCYNPEEYNPQLFCIASPSGIHKALRVMYSCTTSPGR